MTLSCHLLIPACTLTFISMLGVTGLVGCQTIENSTIEPITAKAPKPVDTDERIITFPQSDDNEYIGSWKLPELPVESLNRFDWKLVRWIDSQDVVTHIDSSSYAGSDTVPPLIMDVRPSSLLFKEGCHRYKLFIENAYPMPYPHSISHLVDSTNDCDTQSNVASKGAIQQNLETIFSPRSNLYFNFEPVTLKSKFFIPNSSKQLALNINNNMTLIFTGMRKPEQKTSGLPITNEILERYQWQIISATDKQNDPISNFNDPDVPIIARFYTDSHRRTAGFSVGCNGVSGTYALAVNQTLLIGSSPQTMIGCGDLLNKIESSLSRTMLNSISQLTLNIQENTATSENSTQAMLKYLLTQQLDTGETFIWQNEKKEHRR